MNVFISEPVIARPIIARSAVRETGMTPLTIAIPESPTPRITSASTYLSTIQSKTAPKLVWELVRRAILPSTRSKSAERSNSRLPARNQRSIKSTAAAIPATRARNEHWFGVIPHRTKTPATGSRYCLNRGRRAVMFIAHIMGTRTINSYGMIPVNGGINRGIYSLKGNPPYYLCTASNEARELIAMAAATHRPHVLMMSEITADGKLTLKKGASSKILLHETRAAYDAIMVGANTIRIDNSYLTVRLIPGKSPLRVIPCSMADIPLDANVLGPDAPTLIAVAERAPKDRVAAIRAKGVTVVAAGKDHVDLQVLMQILYDDFGIKKLMIEGGPT